MEVVDQKRVLRSSALTNFDDVRMIRREVIMAMFHHLRIIDRPNRNRDCCANCRWNRRRNKGSPEPETRTDLPGEWIDNHPAHMAQRELGGEKRRPIVRVGRTPKQSATPGKCWRHRPCPAAATS